MVPPVGLTSRFCRFHRLLTIDAGTNPKLKLKFKYDPDTNAVSVRASVDDAVLCLAPASEDRACPFQPVGLLKSRTPCASVCVYMANGDDLFRVTFIVRGGARAAAPPSIDTVDQSGNMAIAMLRLKTICISDSGVMICSGVPIISPLQVVTYSGCPVASIQVRRRLWWRQVARHVGVA